MKNSVIVPEVSRIFFPPYVVFNMSEFFLTGIEGTEDVPHCTDSEAHWGDEVRLIQQKVKLSQLTSHCLLGML